MPNASFRPSVAVYSLIWRALLDRGPSAPPARLGGPRPPPLEPPAGLLQRRRPDEDHHGVGSAFLDLPRPLKLDPEYDGATDLQQLFHAVLRGTIEITRVLRPLEEAVLLDPALELLTGEEDVVNALHLALSRFAGRGRGYERQLWDRLERGPDQGVLTRPGGPRDDDQPSSQPSALIKRSRWPWVSPTRVFDRLIPASLMTRVTFMRPMPRMDSSISSTLAPFSSSEGSMSSS